MLGMACVASVGFAARLWKNKITYPRLGYADFPPVRLREAARSVPLILLTVAAVALLFTFSYLSARSRLAGATGESASRVDFWMAPFFALVIAGVGFVRRAKRLYAIAALQLVLLLAAGLGLLREGLAFGITGLVALDFGLFQLRRFLKENPPPSPVENE